MHPTQALGGIPRRATLLSISFLFMNLSTQLLAALGGGPSSNLSNFVRSSMFVVEILTRRQEFANALKIKMALLGLTFLGFSSPNCLAAL